MYELEESTSIANNIIYWEHRLPKNRQEFTTKVDRTPFPFRAMKVGQSFFLYRSAHYPYLLPLARKYARLYTQKYNRYFAIVEHADRMEIARLA